MADFTYYMLVTRLKSTSHDRFDFRIYHYSVVSIMNLGDTE